MVVIFPLLSIKKDKYFKRNLIKKYGLNKYRSAKIIADLGFIPSARNTDLQQSVKKSTRLQNLLTIKLKTRKLFYFSNKFNFLLGLSLRIYESKKIAVYLFAKSKRGLCHLRKMPVRGQRTHTNRYTQRKLGRKRLYNTWRYNFS